MQLISLNKDTSTIKFVPYSYITRPQIGRPECSVGQHPLRARVLKGPFNEKPPRHYAEVFLAVLEPRTRAAFHKAAG